MSEASHLPVPGASTVWTRLALGLVYFHFGYLKFYPDLSSAELLAGEAAMRLTRYTMDARAAVWWIGLLECGIGVGLLLGVCMRTVGALFLLHMLATFLPLFLIPELTFKFAPLAPTLEGQYILKNLVFLAAGWTLFRPYYSKPLPFSIRRATAAGM